MVRMDWESSLQGNLVAVTPGKSIILPIQVHPVPLRQQNGCEQRKMTCCRLNRLIFNWRTRSTYNAVPGFEYVFLFSLIPLPQSR
jgi:hypothetical protein